MLLDIKQWFPFFDNAFLYAYVFPEGSEKDDKYSQVVRNYFKEQSEKSDGEKEYLINILTNQIPQILANIDIVTPIPDMYFPRLTTLGGLLEASIKDASFYQDLILPRGKNPLWKNMRNNFGSSVTDDSHTKLSYWDPDYIFGFPRKGVSAESLKQKYVLPMIYPHLHSLEYISNNVNDWYDFFPNNEVNALVNQHILLLDSKFESIAKKRLQLQVIRDEIYRVKPDWEISYFCIGKEWDDLLDGEVDNTHLSMEIPRYQKPEDKSPRPIKRIKGIPLDLSKVKDAKRVAKVFNEFFFEFSHFEKCSEIIRKVWQQLYLIRKTDNPVLIVGDTGSGKLQAAKTLHRLKFQVDQNTRKDFYENLFFNMNCSMFSEKLANSQLFGHERGAFTDAYRMKKGIFEKASSDEKPDEIEDPAHAGHYIKGPSLDIHKENGAVFLDEINSLDINVQGMLLKAIDEKKIYRLGGTEEIDSDGWILAATNEDPDSLIEDDAFRPDLYYRFQYVIYMPSLNERKNDIPFLATGFLKKALKDAALPDLMENSGKFTPDFFSPLKELNWKSNVRGLAHLLNKIVELNQEKIQDLEPYMLEILKNDEFIPISHLINKYSTQNLPKQKHEDTNDVIQLWIKYKYSPKKVALDKKTEFGSKQKVNKELHNELLLQLVPYDFVEKNLVNEWERKGLVSAQDKEECIQKVRDEMITILEHLQKPPKHKMKSYDDTNKDIEQAVQQLQKKRRDLEAYVAAKILMEEKNQKE